MGDDFCRCRFACQVPSDPTRSDYGIVWAFDIGGHSHKSLGDDLWSRRGCKTSAQPVDGDHRGGGERPGVFRYISSVGVGVGAQASLIGLQKLAVDQTGEEIAWDKSIMSICTLCKIQIPDSSPESWTTQEGQIVNIARSVMPSAVAATSLGEFEICEGCYERGMPQFFTPLDLAGIHYEFGLEYRDRKQFARSVESLKQALRISETPDILAALASSQSKLGHTELAIGYYQRALEIDPTHFVSWNNLQKLQRGLA